MQAMPAAAALQTADYTAGVNGQCSAVSAQQTEQIEQSADCSVIKAESPSSPVLTRSSVSPE